MNDAFPRFFTIPDSSIILPISAVTMSMTMRALRVGQMSVKSVSCYAATQLPVFARYHTPYNYASPAKPANLWVGLWNCFK